MLTDLMGGQIQYSFDTMTAATPHVKSGKVIAIAQTRAASAPRAIPTCRRWQEPGFPGFEATTWYGLVGPGKLPAAHGQGMNDDVNKVLADARRAWSSSTAYGAEDGGGSREKFAKFISSEIDKWARVVRDGKVQSRCMNLPSLAHFVWLGHPLSGGDPSGPGKAGSAGSLAFGCVGFMHRGSRRSAGYRGGLQRIDTLPGRSSAAGPTNGLTVLLSSLFPN